MTRAFSSSNPFRRSLQSLERIHRTYRAEMVLREAAAREENMVNYVYLLVIVREVERVSVNWMVRRWIRRRDGLDSRRPWLWLGGGWWCFPLGRPGAGRAS